MKTKLISRAAPMLLLLLFAGMAIVGPVSAAEEQSDAVCYCEYSSDSKGPIDASGLIEWNCAGNAIHHTGRASTGSVNKKCETVYARTDLVYNGRVINSAEETVDDYYMVQASSYYYHEVPGCTYRNVVTAESWVPNGDDTATYVFYA